MKNFNSITTLFKTELTIFDKLARSYLNSDVTLINQIANHIINSGGKKLRPILMFYCKNLFGDEREGLVQKINQMAVAIEFIHTATLLHDDVVDDSSMRRNQPTANSLFGNAASVLAGDFLYSRAFQIMTDVGSNEIMNIMANTTNKIAEGEVLQLMNCNNPDVSEKEYLKLNSPINSKEKSRFFLNHRKNSIPLSWFYLMGPYNDIWGSDILKVYNMEGKRPIEYFPFGNSILSFQSQYQNRHFNKSASVYLSVLGFNLKKIKTFNAKHFIYGPE